MLAEWERGYNRGFDDSHPNAPADRSSHDFAEQVAEIVPDEESDDAAFVSDDAWDEVQVQAG